MTIFEVALIAETGMAFILIVAIVFLICKGRDKK